MASGRKTSYSDTIRINAPFFSIGSDKTKCTVGILNSCIYIIVPVFQHKRCNTHFAEGSGNIITLPFYYKNIVSSTWTDDDSSAGIFFLLRLENPDGRMCNRFNETVITFLIGAPVLNGIFFRGGSWNLILPEEILIGEMQLL